MDVLLPLLDDSLPLPPTELLVFLRGPGVCIGPLGLGNQCDVLIVGDGVLAVGDLFLSPEIT